MFQSGVFKWQVVAKLLPSSIFGEVVCFVFYDHHPRDKRCIDITICTNGGEIREYYQRELVSSLKVKSDTGNKADFKEIRILRSNKCELFYLVVTSDEVIILSRKDDLREHKRVSNVQSYEIEDFECKGSVSLQIIQNDDAIPLLLEIDNNFINVTEKKIALNQSKTEELWPIITQLKTKLTEAKYTTKHNMAKYNEYVDLRQAAAFSIYQSSTFNLEDSKCNLSLNKVAKLLQVTADPPVIKLCNKKVVIIVGIQNNNNNVSITEVCPLLHSASRNSIEHTTKIFKRTSESPFWKEKDSCIYGNEESTVVGVVDLKELQHDIVSRIEFEIVISYKKNGKCHLLPVESVSLSALDIMGENFDSLICGDIDQNHLILCILSTSECFDLNLTQIPKPNKSLVTSSEVFYTYMKMYKYFDNVAVYKAIPYHVLYGVMVIHHDNIDRNNVMNIKVYTRFPSQVLALVHYMNDIVPYRIIVTTSDYKVSVHNDEMSNRNDEMSIHNDEISIHNDESHDTMQDIYKGCALSMLHQIKVIKEYLKDCKDMMTDNQTTQEQLGGEVNITILDLQKYLEFRNKLQKENLEIIKSLYYKENRLSDLEIVQ